MFITVRLLSGYQEPLTYKIPDSWASSTIILGTVVQVPLRTQIVAAVVTSIHDAMPEEARSFSIKDARAVEPFPHDTQYLLFAKQIAHYYQIDEHFLIRRIRQFLRQKEQPESITEHQAEAGFQKTITLTDEQQAVVDFVIPSIINSEYNPTLIHGVTGSGKTEIYKRLIMHSIAQKKSTILLLPEVTLALQFERLLKKQLPSSITIRSFHSATSVKEKRKSWQLLVQGTPHLLIGVHLPVLLPMANLGLIIVDEEHEVGYQEKRHPTINSKEIAIWRAKAYNIPIVLGSATPSISSLYNVQTRGWSLFQLTKRYAGGFPTIETVSLVRKEKRRNFWISTALETAIADRLTKKEQTIIFLNRRGYSFFMQCKKCSYIPSCATCSVSLTVHDTYLSCHYCGTTIAQPTQCPTCKADEKNLLKKGIGTQQVVSIIEKLFPFARVARADLDTSSNKKLWQQILHDFEQGAIDILVGTQTITKGYHFPRVTLVGILWADLNLHFPVYNASETTLQQLIQVAGRAGREQPSSSVIVQYMADHDIFAFLDERNYMNFYANELATRRSVGYPPCNRLVEIALKNSDEQIIEHEAMQLANSIRCNLQKNHENINLLGPAKPPVHKIKNIHTRKLYIKGPNIQEILSLIQQSKSEEFSSTIFITPNPLH